MKLPGMNNSNLENSPLNVLIHVIGPNMLQNELLISFLEDNLEVTCDQHTRLDSSFRAALKSEYKHFLLIDCLGEKKADPWDIYNFSNSIARRPYFMAFYNVHPEAGFENKALERGIHGLFYQHESFKVLPKALSAILAGELWYSRKALSQCLINGHGTNNRVSTDMAFCLTDREQEILILIAAGNDNQQIANELCISLHTVKTHIYNIYKKIDVKNRLQAALWAVRYV